MSLYISCHFPHFPLVNRCS